MTAQIVIDDSVNPASAGSTDTPSTFLGNTHTMSNFSDTGVLGWRWTLVSKPIGSSAVLSSTGAATTTLVPDVEGSYLVRLETFSDVARTVADDADEQVVGVRLPLPFDWLVPAPGETTQQGAYGWATAREQAIRDIHSFMNSGAAQLQGAVNEEITTIGSEVVLGGFAFSGGRVGALAPRFEALGTLTVAGAGDGYVRIYDLGTAITPIAPVLRSEVAFLNAGAGSIVQDARTITIATAPGVDADELHDVERLYELRAIIVGGAGGDSLKILTAGLRFT